MAHLDYTERFEEGRLTALFGAAVQLFKDWIKARMAQHALHMKQRRDRAAFQNLLGKEDWVYADMGVHRGDVEYLAAQPLDVNAGRQLECLRKAHQRRLNRSLRRRRA